MGVCASSPQGEVLSPEPPGLQELAAGNGAAAGEENGDSGAAFPTAPFSPEEPLDIVEDIDLNGNDDVELSARSISLPDVDDFNLESEGARSPPVKPSAPPEESEEMKTGSVVADADANDAEDTAAPADTDAVSVGEGPSGVESSDADKVEVSSMDHIPEGDTKLDSSQETDQEAHGRNPDEGSADSEEKLQDSDEAPVEERSGDDEAEAGTGGDDSVRETPGDEAGAEAVADDQKTPE